MAAEHRRGRSVQTAAGTEDLDPAMKIARNGASAHVDTSDTPPAVPSGWSAHRFPRVGAVVLGLAVGLILAEVGLRLVGPALVSPRLPLSYDREVIDRIATGQEYLTFDRGLGWVPTPNAERSASSVRYRHDQAGLRADREYAPIPQAGIQRFAAYGDSFTYCYEVDLRDCWTQRLEETLPSTEVLNFGVPGWAADQAWLRYQRDGAAWQPCAVLIGHMVENINRVVNRFRPFLWPVTTQPLVKPRYVLEGDRLVLLPVPTDRPDDLKDPAWVEAQLGPHDAWYFPGTFVPNPLDRFEVIRLARTAAYRIGRLEDGEAWSLSWAERMYHPGTEAFDVLTAVLTHFAEQVRADGATPVVLVFPHLAELRSQREGGPEPHAVLVAALQQRGIATIDLTEALGEQAGDASVDDLMLSGGHYGPRGNAIVARTLAAQLPALTAETCGAGAG
jgi:hypothetical protein